MLISGIYGGVGSGRLGSSVASRNRGGQYLRLWVKPVNPDSTLQAEIRNFFSVLSQAWQNSLTDAQRLGWEAYAKTVTFRNRIGNDRELTGNAMFVRCNTPRLQAQLSVIADAPVDFTIGEAPKIVLSKVSAIGIAPGPFDGNLEIDLSFVKPPPNGTNILLWVSTPRSTTRNFFKGPYQFAATMSWASSPATQKMIVPVDVPIGVPSRIFFRLRASYLDGRLSQSFSGSADSTEL